MRSPYISVLGGFALAVATAVIVMSSAATAWAGSDKSDYPASFCVPAGGVSSAEASYSISYEYIENDKSCADPPNCWVAYVCPAVNHEPSINGSGHWMYVSTYGGTIYAWLYRRDASTGSGGAGSADTTAYTDGRREKLEPTTSYTGSYTYGMSWFVVYLTDDGYSPRIYGYALDEYV